MSDVILFQSLGRQVTRVNYIISDLQDHKKELEAELKEVFTKLKFKVTLRTSNTTDVRDLQPLCTDILIAPLLKDRVYSMILDNKMFLTDTNHPQLKSLSNIDTLLDIFLYQREATLWLYNKKGVTQFLDVKDTDFQIVYLTLELE